MIDYRWSIIDDYDCCLVLADCLQKICDAKYVLFTFW